MFSGEKLVSRSEISLVIAVCGVLFCLTLTNGGGPLWFVPATTLFLVTGAAFLYALFAGPRAGASEPDKRPQAS
jgi:hypothetical protein